MRPARDTTPDADEAQLAAYCQLGGAARVAIALRLGALTRDLTLSGIRRRHPDYTDRQANQALRRVLLGDDIMRQVYPLDELVDP